MNIEIGKVYKQRYSNLKFAIAKNKDETLIDDHGIHRPYVVFFSKEKVYYLTLKTVSKKNYKKTKNDKFNLILRKDLYDEDRRIAVNCSVINVMDRKLFESLYILDNEKNNFQIKSWDYDKIMSKLNEVFDDIIYAEVSHINEDKTDLVWKSTLESELNKLDCLKIIKGYNNLLFESDIPRKSLLDNPEEFYNVVKSFYEKIKFENDKLFEEFVTTEHEMQSIKYELHINQAIDKLNKELEQEQEQHNKLKQQIIEREKELANKEQQEIEELLELLKTPEQPKNNNQQESQKHHLDNEDDETDTPKPTQSLKLTM
ncbi:Mbov_0400 family ICE element protein [Mycoplasma yeatsii]|uniref:Uncharacterized protein n=1 Tax=Mycoplasma yeatsii TaxID=51365 RepID=A0ABU0NDT7_9MOLU|nr:hypothetical protein [Mycoplasma yeatsii]MDQ0567609.1 hypothetical protein [Mycoplasma yeatsii]